ncbi:glycerophosphodiester phosphodiesterase [Salipiger sp. P9]|uniref:glycerophosphodiester phosphodiesterase family protein n=1 Tax=Salipiger pentaromativorans TaxID=2943193 RepID=UPI0021575975|nr:glycerophosphodiester phosphodiesterase family protein [Salipiger pentaromativorans]MCR8549185.1 glycerophosphodiester phosphodiesterase [Salipiger pentaromativorans]
MTAIIGHRGARDIWPENSLTGFRGAAELGCDAIEFDVHLTDAGELVVIHDPTLERTTEGRGELRKLAPGDRAVTRLKHSDETIPTLDEVLAVLAPAGIALHVEIKLDARGVAYPGIASRVIDRLKAHGVAGRAHLTSFDLDVLRACRALAPEIPLLVSSDAALIAAQGGLEAFIASVGDLADIIALRHDFLSDVFDIATGLWPAGRLCAWTVNDPVLMQSWLARGVGHLTTDRPDLALQLRDAMAV